MAVPLPPGWLDTGITGGYSASGSVKIFVDIPGTAFWGSLGGWTVASFWGGNGAWLVHAPGYHRWYPGGSGGGMDFDQGIFIEGYGVKDPRENPSNIDPYYGGSGGIWVLTNRVTSDPTTGQSSGSAQTGFGPELAWTESCGPYRLGMCLVNIDDSIDPDHQHPILWTNWGISLAWFADESTVFSTSFGPASASFPVLRPPDGPGSEMGGPITVAQGPIGVIGTISFAGGIHDWGGRGANIPQVMFSGLTLNGMAVDTTGLKNGSLEGLGGGAAQCIFHWSGPGPAPDYHDFKGSAWMRPPFQFTYNGRTTRFGVPDTTIRVTDSIVCQPEVNEETGQFLTPYKPHLKFPEDNQTYFIQNASWTPGNVKNRGGVSLSFGINPAYAARYDPPLESRDLQIPIRWVPGRMAPTASGYYQPVEVEIEGEINVQRPDNKPVPPSKWEPLFETCEVREGGTTTAIRTVKPDAGIVRVLKNSWQDWIADLKEWQAMSEEDQARYMIDWSYYEVHKHHDGKLNGVYHRELHEDVWWWSTYSFLEIGLYAPVDTTITLKLDYTHLLVTDPHITGYEEGRQMEVDPVDDRAAYTIDLKQGNNTVVLDLLFPNAPEEEGRGAPRYLGRITAITLTGFKKSPDQDRNPYQYVLSRMKLIRKDDPYLKIGFGAPKRRTDRAFQDDSENADPEKIRQATPDWNVVVASCDGSFPFGDVPDQELKKDEIGHYGGSLRYVVPLTGAKSGLIMDQQMSLKDFWMQFNKIEGFRVTWDQAEADRANRDDFGNVLGQEWADWTWDVLPYVRMSGGKYKPRCSPTVSTVFLANSVNVMVSFDYAILGGLEALVKTEDGKRAGSGVRVEAIRLDRPESQQVCATGVTDRNGYALIYPVPCNNSIEISIKGMDEDPVIPPPPPGEEDDYATD